MQNLPIIQTISFPNTVAADEAEYYRVGKGFHFKRIMKSGEMAGICWIQVYKDELLIAEIKESVCNLYF